MTSKLARRELELSTVWAANYPELSIKAVVDFANEAEGRRITIQSRAGVMTLVDAIESVRRLAPAGLNLNAG